MPHNRSKRTPLRSLSARAAVCRSWLRGEYLVERHLGRALAARPYWRALLEMYLADIEQRSMFSSCFLTGETPSNVHRRSVRLVQLGALTRHPDELDHRRVDLRLTPAIRQSIEQVLDAVVTLDHGLEQGLDTALPQTSLPADDEQYAAGVRICRVTEDGIITLPADMRRALGLGSNTTVLIEVLDQGIFLRPKRQSQRGADPSGKIRHPSRLTAARDQANGQGCG